jgi:cellulose synthase/poly-beta-1,6-N-acetylglucosamine synthase-like glycosyltransferase
MKTALEIAFFIAVGLLLYQQAGYPLLLIAIRAVRRRPAAAPPHTELPSVSLVIAANDEEAAIGERIANALVLDYPRSKLELIVASDGSTDRTAQLAHEAGADLVLELPRGGKVAAQNAAVERSGAEYLAFSDANSIWEPEALLRLIGPLLGSGSVGYACGQLRLTGEHGDNQEGLYWRYEMMLRKLESDLAGITAGNGAIYMTRRDSYIHLDSARSHDGSFPFLMAKRGLRSVYVPDAVASERTLPTIGGEFARKRRIMRPLWDVVVLDGMLSPRGYSPLYAFQVFSHRLLRYAAPLLHLIALGANIALLGEGPFYDVALAAQLAVLAAAALAPVIPIAPFRVARYYVSVTASIAAGLWDRARLGPRSGGWEKAPEAR